MHQKQPAQPVRARTLALGALIVAVAAVAAAYVAANRGGRAASGPWAESGEAAGFNVLLVTIDTLRRDHVGCYGHRAARTPTIDALASQGVLFDDAVATTPLTLPSHATILSGLYPTRHGARGNGRYTVPDEITTLPEILGGEGYETAAFVGCFVLDQRFGLAQGFEVYDFKVTPDGYRRNMVDFNERPANAVTDAALAWLDARPDDGAAAPFFAWVHYFDPHLPYRSPLLRQGKYAGTPYDAEIAFVDQELKRLLDGLEQRGRRDRTLVVVVADHGESLGEHGEPTHGMLLYEAAMRVPFVISAPAMFDRPHRVDDRVVGLVDVTPTVLDLLGIEAKVAMDGCSLLSEEATSDRAIYLETQAPLNLAGWSPLYGLRDHGAKYILAPEPEYYDLTADRAELRNLYTANPAGLNEMVQSVDTIRAYADASTGAQRSLAPDELERLASLGYVDVAEPDETDNLPDPKRMMGVYADALRAETLYAQRRYTEAAAVAQGVLAVSNRCLQAVRVQAFSYLRLGRPDEAVSLLRESVSRNPDAFLVRSLTQALIMDGRFPEAQQSLDLYESVDAADGRIHILRGDIYARQQRFDEALAEYEEAKRIDEHRTGHTADLRIQNTRLQMDAAQDSTSSTGS